MKKTVAIETELMRFLELIDIASVVAPALIALLMRARAGGMKVERYKSGPNKGMLKISLAPTKNRDYSRWDKLNCGPGLEMYKKVQAVSLARWQARNPKSKNQTA